MCLTSSIVNPLLLGGILEVYPSFGGIRRVFWLIVWGSTRGTVRQNVTIHVHVYANSPGHGTNLPVSRTGHQISQIKVTLDLFSTIG